MSAFYVSDGDRFVSSELTRGPWDPDAQHAGPPSALIARALERSSAEGWFIGRVSYEILRPVPIAPVRVEVEVLRPGRSVELVEARLTDDDGEPLVRALSWRLAERELVLPADLPHGAEPIPGPDAGEHRAFFDTGHEVGYHSAMDYRFVRGAFLELGPATVWLRPRHPLVEGEVASALQRLMIAADTGNGVSATLDLARFLFINVDLTVHVHRLPQGEWVCLDAITVPQPNGVGLADAVLHDERGPLGRALQTLLVRER